MIRDKISRHDILCERMKSNAKSQRRSLRKADYETLAQFRYVLRTFAAFSESAARTAGLTPRHHQALLAIHGFPGRIPITIGALSERLLIRHHSAVGLIDRLVAKRLARRSRDPADARRVRVELEPRGRVLLARLARAHRDEIRRLAPMLKRLLARVRQT
jgi:DNA-binding MarR family transcriptional regulator